MSVWDVSVFQLDPSRWPQAQLVYGSFLNGATSSDQPYDVATDANGMIVIAGTAGSTNFPTTGGAMQQSMATSPDGFVTRLDPSRCSPGASPWIGRRRGALRPWEARQRGGIRVGLHAGQERLQVLGQHAVQHGLLRLPPGADWCEEPHTGSVHRPRRR
jgi:hypothetical protein